MYVGIKPKMHGLNYNYDWYNNNDFQFWQLHNQPIVLDTNELIDQKVNYIHNNPVEAGFVAKPEDWLYSSAVDFTPNGKGMLELMPF